jgi:hypothetical protein
MSTTTVKDSGRVASVKFDPRNPAASRELISLYVDVALKKCLAMKAMHVITHYALLDSARQVTSDLWWNCLTLQRLEYCYQENNTLTADVQPFDDHIWIT